MKDLVATVLIVFHASAMGMMFALLMVTALPETFSSEEGRCAMIHGTLQMQMCSVERLDFLGQLGLQADQGMC